MQIKTRENNKSVFYLISLFNNKCVFYSIFMYDTLTVISLKLKWFEILNNYDEVLTFNQKMMIFFVMFVVLICFRPDNEPHAILPFFSP